MPEVTSIGRWLVLIGLGLAALGGLVWLLGRAGLPLGRLPGDFRFATGNLTCFVPLASMLLISLVLTVVVNLIVRLLNR
jgi:hypothetical protein